MNLRPSGRTPSSKTFIIRIQQIWVYLLVFPVQIRTTPFISPLFSSWARDTKRLKCRSSDDICTIESAAFVLLYCPTHSTGLELGLSCKSTHVETCSDQLVGTSWNRRTCFYYRLSFLDCNIPFSGWGVTGTSDWQPLIFKYEAKRSFSIIDE